MWPFLPAPGADDDGSGSMTILESYRALLAANFTRECYTFTREPPHRLTPAGADSHSCCRVPLVFRRGEPNHRRDGAAEVDGADHCIQEGGLLGSQAVAKSYEADEKNILAMSQVR
jgi:hypothetical protein